ncbi:MAG: HAD hydrolase-like protein [Butyrivibrio sp.]|nr:HAD hydrolase-like protein [Butyrivibrio sp.]
MKNNIEWIFFDVGSTLVNEEKVYCHRLQDIADAAGEPFEKIYNMAIDLYKNNKKGDLELTRKYKVSGSKWYLEEEELFEDTEETLKALSPKYKIGIIANQSLGTAERLEKFGIKNKHKILQHEQNLMLFMYVEMIKLLCFHRFFSQTSA